MGILHRLLRLRPDTHVAARGPNAGLRAAQLPPVEVTESIEAASRSCEERRYGAALAILNGVDTSVDDAQLTYAKACTLYAWGRYWEALKLFSRLKRLGFHHPGMFRSAGWAHLAVGHLAEAEAYMRETVAADPCDWQSHYGLGEVLRARDPGAAKPAFVQALARSPENIHCLLNLCTCDLALNDGIAAETIARRAIQVADDNAATWSNLGVALLMQNRAREADEAFVLAEKLASTSSDDPTGDLNRGTALHLLGHTQEAIEYYEAALPNYPSVSAHGRYALSLLTAGKFCEGWDQYEFRWFERALASQRARYDRPAWNGQELRGKVILLRCEQGTGDVFQFIRYAPLVKARGATVFLELRPGLGVLAETFHGIDQTFPHDGAMPDFDYYIDLMSLPRVFRTAPETIPVDIPYMNAPTAFRVKWRDRLTHARTLNVGLVWAGDPRHVRDRQRSMALGAFAPLISIEGTRWLSLQKGPAAEALRSAPFEGVVADLGPDLLEYADTAAAIENLDLVVAVDTSVAHLAGALGKPVWVLLPFSADWRWMEGRDDSPWYPTMRLFRQQIADEWQEVIERVRLAVVELVRTVSNAWPAKSAVVITGPPISVPDEPTVPAIRPSAGRISRACRTRFGMIQYMPGPEPLPTSIEHYGQYLQSHVDILRGLIPSGAVVAEVAAGIGLHSIALASMVGSDGQILAIERSRILSQILRQNMTANDVKSVSVMPSSVAEASLDELKLEWLHVLKINDSAQASEMLGMSESTLWRHRPVLFLAQQSREALNGQARLVADFGYRCWCIDSPLFDPANFNGRNDDVFQGANSLALLAIPEEREPRMGVHPTALITPIHARSRAATP